MKKLKIPDSTLALLLEGYPYFLKRFRRYNTDYLEGRLLLNKTIYMRGAEAAAIFYDKDKFTRKNIAPERIRRTLFGSGGVQGLDGEAHLHRKNMFMQFMTPDNIKKLTDLFVQHFEERIKDWKNRNRIVLFTEVEEILFQAVCEWTAVPYSREEVRRRTRQISSMIDASGATGFRYRRGIRGRKTAEKWLIRLVREVRNKKWKAPKNTVLRELSFYTDDKGRLLDEKTASVEILNFLRPTVAVARYVVFTTLALHRHPEYRVKLRHEPGDLERWFVQEVRRYYPFFPFVLARTREEFTWNGIYFPKNRRVLLDLYGTNHDEQMWKEPEKFMPERFMYEEINAYNFIPQGGGDHHINHRCAGEWITIELTLAALKILVNKMDYDVPRQNLHIRMSRIPAIPESRMILENVRERR